MLIVNKQVVQCKYQIKNVSQPLHPEQQQHQIFSIGVQFILDKYEIHMQATGSKAGQTEGKGGCKRTQDCQNVAPLSTSCSCRRISRATIVSENKKYIITRCNREEKIENSFVGCQERFSIDTK
jgi:hypothetical protein